MRSGRSEEWEEWEEWEECEECEECDVTTACVATQVFFVATGLVIAYFMKEVSEGFSIRRELYMIIVGVVCFLIVWIILSVFHETAWHVFPFPQLVVLLAQSYVFVISNVLPWLHRLLVCTRTVCV